MPAAAIANVDVDCVAPIATMGSYLRECVDRPLQASTVVPDDLVKEAQMVRRVMFNAEEMAQIGDMVAQSCPSCGGPLWEIESSQLLRYRCHIGHSFTARALLESQQDGAEEALWVALRTLEERGRLLERLDRDSRRESGGRLAETYRDRANEAFSYADKIRKLLYSLGSKDTVVEDVEEKPSRTDELV